MTIQSIFITQPVDIDARHNAKEGKRKQQRDSLGSIIQISEWIGSHEDYTFLFEHLLDHPTPSLIGVMALRFGFRLAGVVPYRDNLIMLVFQREVV